jgi:pimeloyl-ACP methyl ester carboxylesterase
MHPRLVLGSVLVSLALAALLLVPHTASATAPPLAAGVPSVYVRPPKSATIAPSEKPLQMLIALHGMGGSGEQLASHLIAQADRNRWLLIAPTIEYGDWTDPTQIAKEDPRLISWLADYIDQLPQQLEQPVRPRVLLIGHSRGAQLAHRFALFKPEKVLAVAALAAGTYTLPYERSAEGALMRFPFGLADMTTIAGQPFSRARLIEDTQFWLGVGTEDNNPNELPRAWDQYIGTTRVQRARAFQDALHQLGARSVLVAFRGERHGFSHDMASSACAFLRGMDLEQTETAQVIRRPHTRPRF